MTPKHAAGRAGALDDEITPDDLDWEVFEPDPEVLTDLDFDRLGTDWL